MSINEAERRIAEARMSRATSLDLSALALEAVPTGVALCKELRSLNISANRIAEIPSAIAGLTGLRQLIASNNLLRSLPAETAALSELRELRLDGNRFVDIPSPLALIRLERLRLDRNAVERIRDDVGEMRALKSLNLAHNRLTELPASLGRLESLESLNLTNNRLTTLPLETLRRMSRLKQLQLHDNPDLPLPEATLGPREGRDGVDRIKLILSEYERLGAPSRGLDDPTVVSEMKVVILGHSSKKTQLTSRLVERQGPPRSTETGFRVKRATLPSWRKEAATDRAVAKLSLWECEGRDPLHVASHLFIGPGCLVVVAVDGLAGDVERNLEYWIGLVRSVQRDQLVPIVAVVFEDDLQTADFDERRLTIEHAANLRAVVRIRPGVDGAWDALKATLEREVESAMPSRPSQPEKFLEFRDVVEREAKARRALDPISLEALFERLGVDHPRTNEFLAKAGELGLLVPLDDGRVVDAEWLAAGLHTILNHPELSLGGEVLDVSRLEEVLERLAPFQGGGARLLRTILIKLRLGFEADGPDGPVLVVPELASASTPPIDFDETDVLTIEYQYTFLPSSFLPRFVAENHERLSKDGPAFWRQGALLAFESNRALVRAEPRETPPRIRIAVDGEFSTASEALRLVRRALDRLNFEPPGLRSEVMLPLPDDASIVVGYEYLRQLQEEGVVACRPPGASRAYSLEELLAGRGGGELSSRTEPSPDASPLSTLRISRVRLENVRHLADMELNFSGDARGCDWVMLLGENGLGKTTVLRAVAAGLADEVTALRLISVVQGLTRHGSPDPAVVTITLADSAGEAKVVRKTTSWLQDGKVHVKQEVEGDDRGRKIFFCGYGAHRPIGSGKIENRFDLFDSLSGLFRSSQNLQNPELVLRRVHDRARREGLLRRIETILDLPKDAIELPDGSGLVASKRKDGPKFPIESLGSGYASTLLWICDFFSRAMLFDRRLPEQGVSGIALVDELEQHLHPRWQRLIVGRISALFPEVQFLATTHSPICAGGLADLVEGRSRLYRLSDAGPAGKVECEEFPAPLGMRYDQIATDLFGIRTATDLTTEEISDRIDEEFKRLPVGVYDSPGLRDALAALKERSRDAFEVKRARLVERRLEAEAERDRAIRARETHLP